MATSGSTNFRVTRDDLIKRALRRIGGIGQGETPDADAYSEAAVALNAIIKEMIGDGIHLWKRKEATITPVGGTTSYKVGVGATVNSSMPQQILYAFRRDSTDATNPIDTPLLALTQQEYKQYPNKSSTGTPVAFLYEVSKGYTSDDPYGTISFWPTPSTTFDDNNTIIIGYSAAIEDFDASSDNLDMPQEYINAIVHKLSYELSHEYGSAYVDRSMFRKDAEESWQRALAFGGEKNSIFLQPETMWNGT